MPPFPQTFSKSTRLSDTSGTTKLARRAGANAGVNVRKLPWAPKDLDLLVKHADGRNIERVFLFEKDNTYPDLEKT